MKLKEYIDKCDGSVAEAARRLNAIGVPVSYWEIRRWLGSGTQKKTVPNRAYVSLLLMHGIEI